MQTVPDTVGDSFAAMSPTVRKPVVYWAGYPTSIIAPRKLQRGPLLSLR